MNPNIKASPQKKSSRKNDEDSLKAPPCTHQRYGTLSQLLLQTCICHSLIPLFLHLNIFRAYLFFGLFELTLIIDSNLFFLCCFKGDASLLG
jgi:hypothetical protein